MSDGPQSIAVPDSALTPGHRAWLRFRRNPPAMLSLVLLAILLGLVLAWPWLAPYPYEKVSEAQFQGPSWKHWFGTDVHGRDLLTRVFFGARISLMVGAVGAGVALIIGVTWGAVAGYIGGRIDSVLMRVVDILYSMPSIVFVVVLITTLQEGTRRSLARIAGEGVASWTPTLLLLAGLGAVSWLTMARIVRGQVLSLRNRAFVHASIALGASHTRILLRHIVPNIAGIVIVYLALTVPTVILYESFLSYLGMGIQPPMASWGSLLAEGTSQLNAVRVYWWLLVIPGGLLVMTLLALNFLGDGLRDALDPKDVRD
jgi:ABC-type dipeptide/oligopeptide/nickel transport system permease subunit